MFNSLAVRGGLTYKLKVNCRFFKIKNKINRKRPNIILINPNLAAINLQRELDPCDCIRTKSIAQLLNLTHDYHKKICFNKPQTACMRLL